jgi:hypothetical protein
MRETLSIPNQQPRICRDAMLCVSWDKKASKDATHCVSTNNEREKQLSITNYQSNKKHANEINI